MNKSKNIFVIVEGPDNVGKTTLINNIKNNFNDVIFQTMHFSNVKQQSSEDVVEYSKKLYSDMFYVMSCMQGIVAGGVICDRSHLGEMVYGPIYRGYTGEYVLSIEDTYANSKFFENLILITCYDDPENLIERDDGLSFSLDLETKKTEISNFLNAHEQSNIKHKLLLNIKNYNAEQASAATTHAIKAMLND